MQPLLRTLRELLELPAEAGARGAGLLTRFCVLFGACDGLIALWTDSPEEPATDLVHALRGAGDNGHAPRHVELSNEDLSADPFISACVAAIHGAAAEERTAEDSGASPYADPVLSVLDVPEGRRPALLALHRSPSVITLGVALLRAPQEPSFNEADRQRFMLLHRELGSYYEHFGRISTLADVRGFPPSVRSTFTALLSGRSEQQLADERNLSRHTVHDHVKQIYRRLGVSSRLELIARYAYRIQQ